MQFHKHKHFLRSLNELWKRGGPFQKAAHEVEALLGRLSASAEDSDIALFRGMSLTHSGETRICHCVKYDLVGHCRLVTVQTDGYCIFLYCGDHDDSQRWIEEHRGMDFVLGDNMRVAQTYRSFGEATEQRVGGRAGHHSDPLYERLPEFIYDGLLEGVPRSVARQLEQVDASIGEDSLWGIVAPITDADQRIAVHDVFKMLRSDRVVEAVARFKQFVGELTPLDQLPEDELPEVVDSDVLRRIDPQSPTYADAMRRFMRSTRYRDWMMFMHPSQDEIVEENFGGPAKLVGVSGSGKTCVVVRRAIRLAEKYPSASVLVLTLNRALAQLIEELVTACCPEQTRERIDVKSFFALCRSLMLTFDADGARLYDELTWKTNEHVDEVWQEYYRCQTNNRDASVLQPVHDSLLARNCNAERYLREEVDWLRSALRREDREAYLDIERVGRNVPLQRPFRERLLRGTQGWEDKMSVVGLVDALGLSQHLMRFLPQIRPRYRCILVDEVQDFGNVELEIVRALVAPGENDLFLSGDAAQAVSTKYQSLRAAGIEVSSSRSRRLTQNYRNSADVLGAAYEVLINNLSDELLNREDVDVLDPEFSTFSGTTPLLLSATSLASELNGSLAVAREKIDERENSKICIAICGYSLLELTRFAESIQLPVLDGATSLDDGRIFLSDLGQTKGFEFDLVCVVNCSAGILPDSAAPPEECYREVARLYVAMTRAKTDLIVSYSGRPSVFLRGAEKKFYAASWKDYVPSLDTMLDMPIPERIDAYTNLSFGKTAGDMTGEEFLYSDAAVGVSLELSAKLRDLVDGQGLMRGREQLKWASLSGALNALKEPRARKRWGEIAAREFSALGDRLGLTQFSDGQARSTLPSVSLTAAKRG